MPAYQAYAYGSKVQLGAVFAADNDEKAIEFAKGYYGTDCDVYQARMTFRMVWPRREDRWKLRENLGE